jgi:hypothetical protein
MPQRPDFDLTADSLVPLLDSIGVLEIGEEEKIAFLGSYYDQDPEFAGLYIITATSGAMYFDVSLDEVETLGFTGSFIFINEGTDHIVRKLQTADGKWMSEVKTELPIEVLSRMVISSANDTIESLISVELPASLPEFEAIYAYYEEKLDIVVSLVYMSSYGIYARVNGGWSAEDISVPSYQQLLTVEVAPERADELIQIFDEKFGAVSVSEVKKYESNELEGEANVE